MAPAHHLSFTGQIMPTGHCGKAKIPAHPSQSEHIWAHSPDQLALYEGISWSVTGWQLLGLPNWAVERGTGMVSWWRKKVSRQGPGVQTGPNESGATTKMVKGTEKKSQCRNPSVCV